jgi:putative phosphonate metabolism protein
VTAARKFGAKLIIVLRHATGVVVPPLRVPNVPNWLWQRPVRRLTCNLSIKGRCHSVETSSNETHRMVSRFPRYAVYFAPPADAPLWSFGRGVLGWDAALGAELELLPRLAMRYPNWRATVSPAAHYGFHATLKPPFALRAGGVEERLIDAVATLAMSLEPINIGPLRVTAIGDFIALVPVATPAELNQLAAQIVCALDPLRAPLSEADRHRRRPERLTQRQLLYLDRWGYPYVLDEFRFHMTLTGPIPDSERDEALSILTALYSLRDEPLTISDLCIFTQTAPAARFKIAHRFVMGNGVVHTPVPGVTRP